MSKTTFSVRKNDDIVDNVKKKANECQLSARNVITRKPQKIECQLSKVSIKCEKCNNKKIRKASVN